MRISEFGLEADADLWPQQTDLRDVEASANLLPLAALLPLWSSRSNLDPAGRLRDLSRLALRTLVVDLLKEVLEDVLHVVMRDSARLSEEEAVLPGEPRTLR